MSTENYLEIPEGLSELGKKAAKKIISIMKKNHLQAGCKVFYSPTEWADRGESYGCNSELVVVYDGGDHKHMFDFVTTPRLLDKTVEELNKIGVYSECCTCWYSAIYKAYNQK